MKVKTLLFSSVFALLIARCNQSPTQTEPPAVDNIRFSNLSPDVLIDLPSCIAAIPSDETGLEKVTENSKRLDVKTYDVIRKSVGYANIIVNNETFGVRAMIEFWRDTINWKEVRKASPTPLSGFIGELKWTAAFYPEKEHHYHLTVEKTGAQLLPAPPQPPALIIEFNGSFDFPKGRVYYHLGRLGIFRKDSLEVEVCFQKKIGGTKFLDVAITGLAPEYFYDPEKVDLSLYSKDGLVHMSGSTYHPDMSGILKNVTEHCYAFTGIVDPLANKSIISLGLPPASYDDTLELFTTYGFADVLTSFIIENEILSHPDSIKAIIATSYSKDLTADTILELIASGVDILVPPETIEEMTVEQFREFLRKNRSISYPEIRAKFNDYLWLSELKQPIYLDHLGYVGNGSDAPPGFSYLDDVEIVPDAKTPSETTGLIIEPLNSE